MSWLRASVRRYEGSGAKRGAAMTGALQATRIPLVGGPYDGGAYIASGECAHFLDRVGEEIGPDQLAALMPWSYELVTIPAGVQEFHYTPPKESKRG